MLTATCKLNIYRVYTFLCLIACGCEGKCYLIGAFDHTDSSSDSKWGCVSYMGLEVYQLYGCHKFGAYYTRVLMIFRKLCTSYLFVGVVDKKCRQNWQKFTEKVA